MRVKSLVVAVLFLVSSGCALINKNKSVYFQSSDPACNSVVENLRENRGLWGESNSFKETLTSEQWNRFERKVKNSNLTYLCKDLVLKVAKEPQKQGPLPLNLVLLVTRFYLEEKQIKQ